MRQGWRWYGPNDFVSLDDIRQAGATHIVSALHDVPIGAAWTREAVAERKNLIETTPAARTPLQWSVIESIPIPDAIKRYGRGAKQEIAAWIASLEAVAECGIRVVCYNFMPVVDWTRTDLDYSLPTGATAMRFDQDKFAAFDLYILQREGAERDYRDDEKGRARATFEALSDEDREQLTSNITRALPGATTESMTVEGFREKLDGYRDIDASRLRRHLTEFLEIVAPIADQRGVKLTLHPDDPPRPLFGLPRIASTLDDYARLFNDVSSPANGMCYCTGSLGVRSDNDLVAMVRQFAPRIHFVHLRATKRDGRSFFEAGHLEGDVDMVAVLRELIAEDQKRGPQEKLTFRPDHGHRMLDDLRKPVNPGYPAIGRLKGLAELRGILHALGERPD